MNVFRVYLKSGQTINVMASDFDILNWEVQERDDENADSIRPKIKKRIVAFFDDDGNDVSPDWLIPYENVSAIVSSEGNLLDDSFAYISPGEPEGSADDDDEKSGD